jgi:hypothetical protein
LIATLVDAFEKYSLASSFCSIEFELLGLRTFSQKLLAHVLVKRLLAMTRTAKRFQIVENSFAAA